MGIGEWQRGPVIGRGASATVSLATDRRTGDVFAVKSVEIARAGVLRLEQSFLSALSSPYVVEFVGSDVSVAEDGSGRMWFNMFMEYAPGGSLADEVKRCGGRCEEPLMRARARDVLRGLAYLHGTGVAHCDVKGGNVLVAADGCAKLADFGCAWWAAEDGNAGTGWHPIRGTPMFMAPEAARGEAQGTAADIWALGCTVIEMATGGSPWPQFAGPVAVLHHVAHSSDVPEAPAWLSDEAKDFLARCLIRDPTARWTAEQLLEHPFVASSRANSPPKVSPTDLWVSPKSILDQCFWEESTMDSDATTAPIDRVRALVHGTSTIPDWTWDENWITVCDSIAIANDCTMSQEFDTNFVRYTDASSSGTSSNDSILDGGDHMGEEAAAEPMRRHVSHVCGLVYGVDGSSCSFCDGNSITMERNVASTSKLSNGFFSLCCVLTVIRAGRLLLRVLGVVFIFSRICRLPFPFFFFWSRVICGLPIRWWWWLQLTTFLYRYINICRVI